MGSTTRQRLARTAGAAFGAVGGLVLAVIITLNVHIWVGLEQGYAATPSEVFDRSVVLGVADIVLLVAGPILGVVVVRRLSHPRHGLDHDGLV